MAATVPIHYALAIFPGFQLLDVAGPLDVLNLLPSITDITSENITLTVLASTLDPVSTRPISPTPTVWKFDSNDTPDLNTGFDQQFLPTATYEQYLNSTSETDRTIRPIDVLIIPGGLGTRLDRINISSSTRTSNIADLRSFVTAMYPYIQHSIITICTGSDVLASTGLLNGRSATTNMSRWNYVTSKHPSVKWLKARRWVKSPASEADVESVITTTDSPAKIETANRKPPTFNKPCYTSAGVSAGIDVMLAFVAEHYGGAEVAREVSKRLEYEWRELEDAQVDILYDRWTF